MFAQVYPCHQPSRGLSLRVPNRRVKGADPMCSRAQQKKRAKRWAAQMGANGRFSLTFSAQCCAQSRLQGGGLAQTFASGRAHKEGREERRWREALASVFLVRYPLSSNRHLSHDCHSDGHGHTSVPCSGGHGDQGTDDRHRLHRHRLYRDGFSVVPSRGRRTVGSCVAVPRQIRCEHPSGKLYNFI